MKNFITSCSLLALVTLPLVSCGSKSDSKKDPAANAPTAPGREPNRVQSPTGGLTLASVTDDKNLLGDWVSPCEVDDGTSMKITMSFKDTYVLQTLKLYVDTRCANPGLDLRIVMNYNAQNGALLFNSQRYSTILQHPALATAASNSNSCGFNKWLAGVEYDITNLTCVESEEGIYFSNNIYGTRTRGDYTITGSSMDLDGISLTRTATLSDIRSITNVESFAAALPGHATAGFAKQ